MAHEGELRSSSWSTEHLRAPRLGVARIFIGKCDRHCLPRCQDSTFNWSGSNSHEARIKAGRRLAARIRQVAEKDPDLEIGIIGHSHGGMVALSALRDNSAAALVTSVIFLGTPFFRFIRMEIKCQATRSTRAISFPGSEGIYFLPRRFPIVAHHRSRLDHQHRVAMELHRAPRLSKRERRLPHEPTDKLIATTAECPDAPSLFHVKMERWAKTKNMNAPYNHCRIRAAVGIRSSSRNSIGIDSRDAIRQPAPGTDPVFQSPETVKLGTTVEGEALPGKGG